MAIQYYTATSINGFIADEEESLDWLFQFGEIDSLKEHYPAFIKHVGAAVMGSSTYEWLLNHEKLTNNPGKWPYEFPVWVFSSRTLPVIENADIRFVKGNIAEVYSEIKESSNDKNIWIIGGGDLAGQFYDTGHLDELILTVAPVMLQSGAPIFPRTIVDSPLALKSVERHSKDFIVLTYRVINN